MNKKLVALIVGIAMVLSFAVGVYASYNVETIKAFLCYDVDIRLDGKSQRMYGAAGGRVYPIIYNGSTYVPLSAIAEMFDTPIEWDGQNRIVYLGQTGKTYDFIQDIKPYSGSDWLKKNSSITIVDRTVYGYIHNAGGGDDEIMYNLNGKYRRLSFTLYNYSTDYDSYISIYGDGEELFRKRINKKELPKEYVVDVNNVSQLIIEMDGFIYLYDATIK